MATTTATINVSSSILAYPVSINKSMTMKKLASCNGLDETTGLRTKKLFPYNGNTNITVASDGGIEQILEYMVFADGIVTAAG